MAILYIFNTAPFEHGMNGITGFNYQALKDAIKWYGLKPKEYVPRLINCMESYLKGTRQK